MLPPDYPARSRSPISVSPLFITVVKSSDRSRSAAIAEILLHPGSATVWFATSVAWFSNQSSSHAYYQFALDRYHFCPTPVVLDYCPAVRRTALPCSLNSSPTACQKAMAASYEPALKAGVLIGLTLTLLKINNAAAPAW